MKIFTSIPFETAQSLQLEAQALNHELVQMFLEQSDVVLAVLPYKARWEKEFAQLERLGRILKKAGARVDRRSLIVHRFFI